MMKKFLMLGTALSLVFGASVVSAGTPPSEPAKFKIETSVTEITATVKEIDHKARTVTLVGPEENLISTKVDDDVENFNKVKKGNKVDIQLYESTALAVKKNSPKKDVMKHRGSSL